MLSSSASVKSTLLSLYKPKTLDFCSKEQGLESVFSNNLKHLRHQLDWCQTRAADEMDVSIHQYRKYERGGDYPRMSSIALLMQRSGIPFPYLFIGSGYDDVFHTVSLRRDLLPMQVFAGRSNDVQFNAMVTLLCDNVGAPVPAPDDISTLRWPEPTAVAAEIDQYYSLVARGLRDFRQLLGLSQREMAEHLDVATRTLARYELDVEEPHFNVIMALRLWASTGIPPIWLMVGTQFFNMRMLQHQRMAYLCELLKNSSSATVAQTSRAMGALSGLTDLGTRGS